MEFASLNRRIDEAVEAHRMALNQEVCEDADSNARAIEEKFLAIDHER
jgi:hypothetical protein